MAAASINGIGVSLLRNLDRKGGVAAIMRCQFWRVMGVAIVRSSAQLKFLWLHYIQAAAEEDVQVCRANHSAKGWQPHGQGHLRWFSAHVLGGYGNFK